jgi:hypothetical protein
MMVVVMMMVMTVTIKMMMMDKYVDKQQTRQVDRLPRWSI